MPVCLADAAAPFIPKDDDDPGERQQPMFPAASLKWIVLALLVLQNSFTAVLTRATRTPRAGFPMYSGNVAVVVAELIKLPVCLLLIWRDRGSAGGMVKEVNEKVFKKPKDTLAMGVPALCYCLQNALFFTALSNLSATSYQLWSQSKTLFTALFFTTMLGRTLRKTQWLALLMLTAGVGLVQIGEVSSAALVSTGLPLLGVGAVLASSLLSGFSNVYLERVVKKSEVTIWVRNVQLGLFSIPQALALLISERAILAARGPLAGFDLAVWGVVALKALGGLLVAAVVKYADNVLKTYATAIAIVLTCVWTCVGSRTLPTIGFLNGMALVLASLFLYNGPAKQKK